MTLEHFRSFSPPFWACLDLLSIPVHDQRRNNIQNSYYSPIHLYNDRYIPCPSLSMWVLWGCSTTDVCTVCCNVCRCTQNTLEATNIRCCVTVWLLSDPHRRCWSDVSPEGTRLGWSYRPADPHYLQYNRGYDIHNSCLTVEISLSTCIYSNMWSAQEKDMYIITQKIAIGDYTE